jgi:glycosyltransferase involved in cell wall biosynthesis
MHIGYKGKRIVFVSKTPCEAPQGIKLLVCKDLNVQPATIINDYEIWDNQVFKKSSSKPFTKLKVALVGVYKIQCGISTYAEQMFPRIKASVAEAHIFAEKAEVPEEEGVTRCWKRGEPLTELINKIHAFYPDIVYLEHEFGIFPNAGYWLSFCTQMQNYRLIVKQHSVFYHKDKMICEAAVPEIIVHSNIGKKVLGEKGVPSKIYVIPHGCTPCKDLSRNWNMYHSEQTIMQFGFGFHYKGWENAIRAVGLLKDKYPKIFYTGLFSESSFNKNFHGQYYEQLMKLVSELGLMDHIAIIRGYQSDASLDSYFRTNQIAVFPYTANGVHTVYGVTGAARLAMGTGTPTIVSSVAQFDDLEGVCPRPSSVEELAFEIEKFFLNPALKKEQVERQNKYLVENSWDNVVEKHLRIFSGDYTNPS